MSRSVPNIKAYSYFPPLMFHDQIPVDVKARFMEDFNAYIDFKYQFAGRNRTAIALRSDDAIAESTN